MRWLRDPFQKLRPTRWFAWRPVTINFGFDAGTVVWLEYVDRWEEHSMQGSFWCYRLREGGK
jgi:hypothetical protein